MEDITFNRRYEKPPVETWEKILSSKEEAAALALRDLKCPICGFKLMGVYGHTGYINVKCQKCKFTGPLNLAYFHTRKNNWTRWSDVKSPLSE
ncbi:MAG: hypothetical protein Q4A88_06480 [Clostridia bacterium]|nr:hypothetical protein [Clostridia bacterium]